MDLNSFLFPAPESYFKTRNSENVVWIPKRTQLKIPQTIPICKRASDTEESKSKFNSIQPEEEDEEYIPCLYLPYSAGSDKFLLFFHGNAEDIGYSSGFVQTLQEILGIHILSVEYPGYSLYIGEPDADRVLEDAEFVYDFLNLEIGVPQENIFVFGRSLGTGPACHLAAKKDPAALILLSAYTSIKAVVKDVFGAAYHLIAERFNNLETIQKVRCPILLLHGKADKLISKKHSLTLKSACKENNLCHIRLSEYMTHNDFDIMEDIIAPMSKFLAKNDIKIKNTGPKYKFPADLYKQPTFLKDKKNQRTLVSIVLEKLFT